jgi:hypothetical protein
MTDPSGVPTDQQSTESNETETQDSGKRYFVKTPWHVTVLHDPEGNFPDVTSQGVEMSATERDAAKAGAKAARVKLLSKEV